jgi:hypothetical protein
MPTHPTTPNPVFAPYDLECSWPGCGGKQKVEQAHSAGLRVGDLVPMDGSDPSYGRCPMCKRHAMKVKKGPEPAKPKGPKGFTKVPTE